MPAVTFSGKLEIHFRPSTRSGPPIEAGSAMIRADGPVGEAQEVGRRVHRVAGAVQPVGRLDQFGDLPFPAAQRLLDLGAGDHRERRHAHGRRAHRLATSMVGEQSARCTGSASPASTSRGPS